MKFEIRHRFDAPVEEVERVLFHPDLAPLLVQRMDLILGIEPLESSRSGEVLTRRVRYSPKPTIERIGTKKVQPEWLVWVEESRYDFSRHQGEFRNVPVHPSIAEYLENRGALQLVRHGAGGCEQVLSGELTVKVFMVGRIAEPIIKSNAVKILDQQAAAMQQIITEGLL